MALTLRQKILKIVYPLFIWSKKKVAAGQILQNTGDVKPPTPFYSLSGKLINGKELPFEKLRGKKVLLVNTASDCGYTPQYAELQKLYQYVKEDLEIIAFPANDFKEQEKRSDEDIARFCSVNYGVSFPIAKKSSVIKSREQNPVFHWLTHKALNGWNDRQPSWNFTKYLVNEEGKLTHCFHPSVSPLSTDIISAINKS